MSPVEITERRYLPRLRLSMPLALVGLLATLAACVSPKPPKLTVGEPAGPPVAELFAALYGPLANPDFPRRPSWRLGGGFGAADPAVGELLDHWQRRQRPYLAAIRRQGFSRRQFYAEIETWLEGDDFRLPRATLQKALAEPLADDQRQRLEAVLIVHEHAFLTYVAVAATNRLAAAPGELAGWLPALRRLPAFRSEFAAWLPATVDRLAASERLAGDAAGEELAELLPKPLGDFQAPAGDLRWRPDPDNQGEAAAWFAEAAIDAPEWQPLAAREAGGQLAPASSNEAGSSWFAVPFSRLVAPAGKAQPKLSLIVWNAEVAVDIFVDGIAVGTLRPAPAIPQSESFAIPVGDQAEPPTVANVVLRVDGDRRQLPCRGLWLVGH